MKTRLGQMAAAAVAALACVGSVQAHHSISMFDISTPFWVKGTVVTYKPIAPHAMIELAESKDDGRVQRWTIEGPFPGRLGRILKSKGLSTADGFVKPGDTVEVCGFALNEKFSAEKLYPGTDVPTNRFIHAQIIVMPDGHMQSWGPYGKIENCVRRDDKPQLWIDFLNKDPLARDLWCGGLDGYHREFATVPPEAFVEEVGRRMDDPCN
jgi:Family of unknown function (DUF6152)